MFSIPDASSRYPILPSSGLSRYRLPPNSCASRSVSVVAGLAGLSVKRTVLEAVRTPLGRRLEVEEACAASVRGSVGDVVACLKSALSVGSFGCVRVDALEGEEKPWNWAVRSLYCFCRPGKASEMVSASLCRLC